MDKSMANIVMLEQKVSNRRFCMIFDHGLWQNIKGVIKEPIMDEITMDPYQRLL